MGRRRGPKRRWAMRVLGALLLAGLAGGAWFWWDLQHWTPPLEQYPDQGALVGEEDGTVKFRTLRALGANFVYLEASQGANAKDARFTRNYAAAREAGLQIGAVHRFDPCVLADGQSANFVTTVPRAKDLLPPAIELDVTAQGCPERVSDAAVQSELMTLINQVIDNGGVIHEGDIILSGAIGPVGPASRPASAPESRPASSGAEFSGPQATERQRNVVRTTKFRMFFDIAQSTRSSRTSRRTRRGS